MKIWFSNTIPYGWLLCNGQSCASYPNLATFLGKNTVPDLRGEFLRGAGTNSHGSQGNGGTVGQHQDATRITNTDSWFGDNKELSLTVYRVNADKNPLDMENADSIDYATYKTDGATRAASWTSDTAPARFASRPTNTSVNYIIKW